MAQFRASIWETIPNNTNIITIRRILDPHTWASTDAGPGLD